MSTHTLKCPNCGLGNEAPIGIDVSCSNCGVTCRSDSAYERMSQAIRERFTEYEEDENPEMITRMRRHAAATALETVAVAIRNGQLQSVRFDWTDGEDADLMLGLKKALDYIKLDFVVGGEEDDDEG